MSGGEGNTERENTEDPPHDRVETGDPHGKDPEVSTHVTQCPCTCTDHEVKNGEFIMNVLTVQWTTSTHVFLCCLLVTIRGLVGLSLTTDTGITRHRGSDGGVNPG